MKTYQKRISCFLNCRYYMYAVLFTALLCYGFSATNITIGPDSMEGGRYLGAGNEMLASGRFGMKLWAMVMGYGDSGPAFSFCIAVLAAALLVLAAIHFSMIFRMVSGGKISLFGCGVFSCALISYPLMNEIWEYNGANLCVCGGYFLDSVVLYLVLTVLRDQELTKKQKCQRLALACLAMTVVCASYESLVVVYIFMVFAILTVMQLYDGEKWSFGRIFRWGIVFAAVLLCGILLRLVIHRLILVVMDIPYKRNGATGIAWGSKPVSEILSQLFRYSLIYYFMRGCAYFPILEMVISAGLLCLAMPILALWKKRPWLLLTGFGMLLCLMLLQLIQGTGIQYRTCQVFGALVAFVALGVSELAIRFFRNRKLGLGSIQVLLVLLCLHQSTSLSRWLVLDHLRSEEEAFTIRTIGTDLERAYDLDKTVIVLGRYPLGDGIMEEITADMRDNPLYQWFWKKTAWDTGDNGTIRISDHNVYSVLRWSENAFSENGTYGTSVEKLFRFYGFRLHTEHDPETHAEATRYVIDNDVPGYPKDGYIVELENYIIVNLLQGSDY